MSEERRTQLEIPDRRKNTYQQLETHLDERVDKILDDRVTAIEKRLARWLKSGLIAFSVIALFTVVALLGYGFIIREQHRDAVERCKIQNIRHDNATYSLIAGSNQDQLNAPTAAARAEIRRRRDVSLALIDAIAPKTDCDHPDKVKALPQVTPIPEG